MNPILLASLCISLSACGTPPGTPEQRAIIDKLVFVKGGTFQMGDAGFTDEQGQFRYRATDRARPVHQVTLTSYSIQAFEVTFTEFDRYSNAIGEEIVGADRRHRKSAHPDNPAKWLTWYQARGYCQWLGEQIGYTMDLPTEAQWEYAARSRGNPEPFYATNNGLKEWGVNFRDPDKNKLQMPVGSWPPNPLGLYDMSGNVNEWTLDSWHGYRKKPLVDPSYETARSKQKVTRGGGVIGTYSLYNRRTVDPNNTGGGTGVRCAVNHPEKITEPNKKSG